MTRLGNWWAERRKAIRAARRARTSGEAIERGTTLVAFSLVAGGVILAFLFNLDRNWARVLATGLAIFLASGVLGAFAGFIFGLPRDAPTQPDAKPVLRFLFNSNLLKVSDWVTTIIVGLTLVNLRSVGPVIADLGEGLEEPLGGHEQSAAFGIAITLFGFAGAAILCYLWTTVRLRQHLERSELELLQDIRNANALQVAADYVRGKATEEDVRVNLASMSDYGLDRLLERLPMVAAPEAQVRRDRIRQLVSEQQAQGTS